MAPKRCVCCNYVEQSRSKKNSRDFRKASTCTIEELSAFVRDLNQDRQDPIQNLLLPLNGAICENCYRAILAIRRRPLLDNTPDLTIWRDAPSSHASCLFSCGAKSEDLQRITKSPEFRRKLLVDYQVSH